MRTEFYLLKFCLLVPFFFVINNSAQAQQNDTTKIRCGAAFSYEQLINSTDQSFAQRYRQFDQFTKSYVQRLRQLRREGISDYRSSPIIIPVVVHVVSNSSMPYVSDAQVQSQIDALNRDYRRLNADISSVPGVFSSRTSDCLIEFRLAVRDPTCMPTTGITRTLTTVSSFPFPVTEAEGHSLMFNPVKSTAAGGHDAWPRDKYLNIWVCDIRRHPIIGNVIGYSSWPTDPANVDGVVIDYTAFGTTGTAIAPFNLGRTATHEIGHWLNLFHISGDDTYPGSPVGPCDGSDQVDDTPNQYGQNSGCPSFPHISCSNGPNGDLFMNYMDYTDDACMFMFTTGQAERMDATLYGARAPLLASDALIPASGIVGTTPDIFMQDKPDDMGNEPNSTSSSMYESEDIWVRNQDDGLTNQEHQNPLYRPVSSGNPNYIYVRVRNRGCSGAGVSGTLKLYWAKASSALGWSSPWDGSITTPASMGGGIGAGTPVAVTAGGFQILRFSWYPPNPSEYASFGIDQSHFCLLARIETSATPPYGMTTLETGDLWANVQNNNNIVWKNVTVVTEAAGGMRLSSVVVGNFSNQDITSKLYFKSIWTKLQQNFLQYGKITIALSNDLYNKWSTAGKSAFGLKEIGGNQLLVENANAWMAGLNFKAGEIYGMKFIFQFSKKIPFGSIRKFDFKVEQTAVVGVGPERLIGGETFIIKSLPEDISGPNVSVLGVQIKAWLQGAYQQANGLMLDSLRTKTLLPGTTPYPALNFTAANNSATETIDAGVLQRTGSEAITDWVWVELRDADTIVKVVSTRSALLRRDGSVVDMDGVSPVYFNNLASKPYYIALRHRNHLGVMTAGAVPLNTAIAAQVDFTSPNTPTYGTDAQFTQNGVMMMWAGDVNGDKQIRYNGASNDKNTALSRVGLNTSNNTLTIYDRADVNLDGKVRYNGAANDKNEILKTTGLLSPNRVITEQIPN